MKGQDDYKPYIIYEGGASQKVTDLIHAAHDTMQGECKSEEEQDNEPFAQVLQRCKTDQLTITQANACNNSLFIALRDEVSP